MGETCNIASALVVVKHVMRWQTHAFRALLCKRFKNLRFFHDLCIQTPVFHRTRTRGNEVSDDHIFLQPQQRVNLALHRGFGQHAGGFLKDAAEIKLSVKKRGAGNAQ